MSAVTAVPATPTTPADTPAEPPSTPAQPDPSPAADAANPGDLGDAGKRAIDAMKAERNAAKAELARVARELQEIKDRDLSDLERAKKAEADTAAELAALRRTSLQQQVALDKGIPADLVTALNGSTIEELSAHADRLLAWRGTVAPPAGPPNPRPDQGQGRGFDPAAVGEAEYTAHMQHLRPNHR